MEMKETKMYQRKDIFSKKSVIKLLGYDIFSNIVKKLLKMPIFLNAKERVKTAKIRLF
jgi:hypothetical protein